VPAELSAILDRLLAKDPRDRFATPADVAVALEPFCRGANLSDLMVRALEGHGEGGDQGEGSIRSNLRAGASQDEGRIRSPHLPGEGKGEGASVVKSMSRFWKRFASQLILLMMIGGIALALGIMIRIHKDGKETAVEVPEGSKARVTADGQLEVTLPGQTAAGGGTDATKPEQIPAAPFIGRLPQGTVELVGIRDYLSDDQTQWWQPNGAVVHLGPFQSRDFHAYVGAGVQGRDFLVRFKDLPADARWPAWKLKPSDHWDGSEVKDVSGNIVPNYKMLSALLPASARTADFQIGVGMGQWETVARQGADSAGTSTFSRDGKQWTVTFQQATAGELVDSTRITLDHAMHYKWNVRLVAVDSDGKEHALGLAQHSAGDISHAAAVFKGLPLSSVKEFQLQVRPYYWVEFRNIALQSGQKTDVQVVLPGRTKSAEGAQNAGASGPAAPPEVTVIRPTVRQITQYVDFTGQTEAVQTADVRARVTGRLAKVLFEPGTMVKQGQVLFEIDPAPFQAGVDKRDADVRLAQLRLNRTTAELQNAKAPAPSDRQRLEAQRAEAEAALTAAQEGLKVARLNLASTRLTAPISGKIGRPLVPAGSLVAGTKPLATIDSVDPICVAFAVDERTLVEARRNPPRLQGEPGLPILVGLADEKGFPHKAKFEPADTRVDPATGTARWRALLPNPDGLLMPGLFVRVRLVTSDPFQALLLPETALAGDQGRKFVWIVTGPNLVQSRNVEIGPLSEDGMRVVNKGLTADDWVVEKAGFQHSLPWKAGMTFKPKKVEIQESVLSGAKAETADVFGPVIERVVESAVSGKSAIDLDTGKLYTGPQVVKELNELDHWMKATGVDALGMTGPAVRGLGGFDMVALAVENDRWNVSVAELKATLVTGKPGTPQMIGKGELPASYLFKTREGGMGVLQIVGFSDTPQGVKIRYKLARKPVSAAAVAMFDSGNTQRVQIMQSLANARDEQTLQRAQSEMRAKNKEFEAMLQGTVAEIPMFEQHERLEAYNRALREKDKQEMERLRKEMESAAAAFERLIHGTEGAVLIYEVDPASAPAGMSASDFDNLLKAIDRRLNSGSEKLARLARPPAPPSLRHPPVFRYRAPRLRKLDDGRIEVALLHNNDAYRQRVERLLASPGTLEFRILASNRQDKAVIEQARRDQSKAEVLDPSGKRLAWWVPVKAGEENSLASDPDVARRSKKQDHPDIAEILVVTDSCNVTGAYLAKAEASADNSGHPCINFTFNDAGGKLFAKLTGDHLPDVSTNFRYRLGIILDGELCSAPSIQSVISNRGVITGSFSKEQVADLADTLNAGSLPVRIRLVRRSDPAAAVEHLNKIAAADSEDRSAAAVRRGLAFLAARQRDDGSYGPESHAPDVAVIPFVSRAMMASGSTPGKGPYGERLAKGLAYLLGCVQQSGLIHSMEAYADEGMPMYGHAFALTFLAECQKVAPSSDIKEKIDRAVTVIVKSQNKEGGWRYSPEPRDADLSVTAVLLLALAAAREAGIDVPQQVIDRAIEYVKKRQNDDGGFRYMGNEGPSAFPRSAAAVAALYRAGAGCSDVIRKGSQYVAEFPAGDEKEYYLYGQYFAAQAMSHANQADWDRWSAAVRDRLLGQQREDGSWTDPSSVDLGTAMACLTLQTKPAKGVSHVVQTVSLVLTIEGEQSWVESRWDSRQPSESF